MDGSYLLLCWFHCHYFDRTPSVVDQSMLIISLSKEQTLCVPIIQVKENSSASNFDFIKEMAHLTQPNQL